MKEKEEEEEEEDGVTEEGGGERVLEMNVKVLVVVWGRRRGGRG